ncbi:MAG: hypothetical protein ACKVW3_03245 [Phycisphaerales bacterium]
MKAVSEFVVHASDLIEAEGRALLTVVRGEARRAHAAAVKMTMAAALLLVTVPLTLAGLGLIGAGLMWWLETVVSRSLAACLTGLATLGVAGAMLLCFTRVARSRAP